MKDNQWIILDASSFKSKDKSDETKLNTYNVFQIAARDGYGQLKCSSCFVDSSVFEMYTGPGVYDVVSIPYFDRKGAQRAKLLDIKRVKAIEF